MTTTPYPDHEPPQPTERAPRWPAVVQAFGEVLVTLGLVALLFVVYELFVTDVIADRAQEDLSRQLQDDWDSPSTPVVPAHESKLGDAFAVLHIPRLGLDYERVVLEGTQEKQLSQGPGHYTDTAMPGEQGNVSFAGHRIGRGAPFLELDLLQPGDPIVVETADSWFVYRVLGDVATGDVDGDPSGIPGRHIVRPEAMEVIAPTPGGSVNGAPTGAYLTLTTCHPRYSAEQRLIVHASLDAAIGKADQPNGPAALSER